jgi:hypothetical protein
MKVDRRCPRCRASHYHFCDAETGQKKATVRISCAACGHTWTGRLTRCERDIPDEPSGTQNDRRRKDQPSSNRAGTR